MPTPERVDHPSKLSNEALYCQAFGHSWWVSMVKRTAVNIGGSPQDRQYYACENGCKCRKRCLVDKETGERWGWSRVAGEKYGTIGGWKKADFIAEWIRRQDEEGVEPPSQAAFQFDDETMSLIKMTVDEMRKIEARAKKRKASGAA